MLVREIEAPPSGRVSDTHPLWFFQYNKVFPKLRVRFEHKSAKISPFFQAIRSQI
jgi:hypothetical protein